MVSRVSTLLDILSSQQFQIVILLALGLDTRQIADLLETGEPTVCLLVCDSFDRTGCRSPEALAIRLIHECENHQYDERLITELTVLQGAAKRMLKRIASATS